MMSIPRSTIVVLAALFCACGGVRPARAQTSADTAALARATASLLADSVLPQIEPVVVWQDLGNPFGAAVAENLRGNERLPRPAADPEHAVRVGVREVRMDDESARVLVETWAQPGDDPGSMTGVESNAYFFERTPEGWRFVRRQFVGNADFGAIRGR
jgi:hypothetical protein